MKHVSLLPPEIKAERLAQNKRSRLYLLLVIAIILLLFINLYLLLNVFFSKQELIAYQDERNIVDNRSEALVEYEKLYQRLTGTEKLVNDAMGTVPLWGEVFRDISQNLPVGAQLSEIRMNYDDQIGTVVLRGWTGDHNALANLLKQLESIEQIDQISCRVSTGIGAEGQEAVQFMVESVLLPGPVFLEDAEGGE